MADVEEQAPLVPKSGKTGKAPREWRGHPLNTFGECSATDAAACCLAWNAAPIAFGFNASRGLGLSWWKEAIKLFLLTCGAFCLVKVALMVLVQTQCGKECPYAHKDAHSKDIGAPMSKLTTASTTTPRVLLGNLFELTDAPNSLPHDPTTTTTTTASVATQTNDAAVAVSTVAVSATSDKPASDKPASDKKKGKEHKHDHEHEHEHEHKDHDHEHKEKEHDHDHDEYKHTAAAADIANVPYILDDRDPDAKDKDNAKPHEFGFRFEDHKAKKGCKDKEKRKEHDKEEGRAYWHKHDDVFEMMAEHPKDLEKCVFKIAPWASIVIAVGIAVFVYGTYFAALRRQMLRERFGIEGKFSRDWLLWAFCGPCVLTQETRTLMHNNVEEGMWHGALSAPSQVAPMAM